MTPERGREPELASVRRLPLPAELVRPGDTVVFTNKREQEYRFCVEETDPTWLTFETGQMVHKDRYEREDFAVLRPTAERSTTGGDDGVETANSTNSDDGVETADSTGSDDGAATGVDATDRAEAERSRPERDDVEPTDELETPVSNSN